MKSTDTPVRSVSRLLLRPAAAPDQPDTLFVADWKASALHAFELPASAHPTTAATAPRPYLNVTDLQTLLPAPLRSATLALEDVAVRPGTDEVYVALSAGSDKLPIIVMVTGDESARVINLGELPHTVAQLADPIDADFMVYPNMPGRTFTVSALCAHGDSIYVAGVTNTNFRSTLRVVPFPFTGEVASAAVEIYHLGHRQVQTRSPIRAMTVLEMTVDGVTQPYLMAGYLCTPLALFPLADIDAGCQSGAPVTGKAFGELGAGGIPFAVIPFASKSGPFSAETVPKVLVANELRQSVVIPVATIAHAASASVAGFTGTFTDGMGTVHGTLRAGEVRRFAGFYSEHTAGVVDVQMQAMYRVAYVPGADHFIGLRRSLQTGNIEVVGINTMLGLRMTDYYPREYDFAVPQVEPDDKARYWTSKTRYDGWATVIYNQFKDLEGMPELKQWIPPAVAPKPMGAPGGAPPAEDA